MSKIRKAATPHRFERYEALCHAVRAHSGQLDKAGKPYIFHPMAVADAVEAGRYWKYEVVVALLHDVPEDQPDYPLPWGALTNIQKAGLKAITQSPDQSYSDYIKQVCEDEVACYVKLADLWHNLSPERQDGLDPKEAASLEKRYLKARERIWKTIGEQWWPE